MAKQQIKHVDINGIQICVGDKVACSDIGYGNPSHQLKTGIVTKLNAQSIKYRIGDNKWDELRLTPSKTVLVLEGEFIPKSTCKCGS